MPPGDSGARLPAAAVVPVREPVGVRLSSEGELPARLATAPPGPGGEVGRRMVEEGVREVAEAARGTGEVGLAALGELRAAAGAAGEPRAATAAAPMPPGELRAVALAARGTTEGRAELAVGLRVLADCEARAAGAGLPLGDGGGASRLDAERWARLATRGTPPAGRGLLVAESARSRAEPRPPAPAEPRLVPEVAALGALRVGLQGRARVAGLAVEAVGGGSQLFTAFLRCTAGPRQGQLRTHSCLCASSAPGRTCQC